MLKRILMIFSCLMEAGLLSNTLSNIFLRKIQSFYHFNKNTGDIIRELDNGIFRPVLYSFILMTLIAAVYIVLSLYIERKYLSPVTRLDSLPLIDNHETAASRFNGYKKSRTYKFVIKKIIVLSAFWAFNLVLLITTDLIDGLQKDAIISISNIYGMCVLLNLLMLADCLQIAKMGKRLVRSVAGGNDVDKPVYILHANIDVGLSSFSREIRPFSFSSNDFYILLSEAESMVLPSLENLYRNTTLVVYLINPLGGSEEYIDKLTKRLQFFNAFPHIRQLGLFLETPQKNQGWEGFMEKLSACGELKFIDPLVDKSGCLSEQLLEVVHSDLIIRKIFRMENSSEILEGYAGLSKLPDFLYSFIKRLLCSFTLLQMFFGLFDIIDLGLRLACFSNIVSGRRDAIKPDELGSFSFRSINSIVKSIASGTIHDRFPAGILSQEETEYLEQFLNCRIQNREITLPGAVMLVTYIRNKTKGHGRISDESLNSLVPILFKLMIIILSLLRLDRLAVKTDDSSFCVETCGQEYNLAPFVIVMNKKIYFYQQTANKNALYIDYSSGEYLRPSFEEIGMNGTVSVETA